MFIRRIFRYVDLAGLRPFHDSYSILQIHIYINTEMGLRIGKQSCTISKINTILLPLQYLLHHYGCLYFYFLLTLSYLTTLMVLTVRQSVLLSEFPRANIFTWKSIYFGLSNFRDLGQQGNQRLSLLEGNVLPRIRSKRRGFRAEISMRLKTASIYV